MIVVPAANLDKPGRNKSSAFSSAAFSVDSTVGRDRQRMAAQGTGAHLSCGYLEVGVDEVVNEATDPG